MTEQTPLIATSNVETAESGLASPPVTFNKGHLQTGSNRNTSRRPTSTNKGLPKIGGQHRRANSLESGDILAVTSKQTKTRQRKNVSKFRRKRQDYATWKGRVGVHVEYDEIDLNKLINVIYQTLPTEWELVDCYDVIRLWLPVDSHHFSGGEDDVPAGGGEYTEGAEGDGQIHASMPEV